MPGMWTCGTCKRTFQREFEAREHKRSWPLHQVVMLSQELGESDEEMTGALTALTVGIAAMPEDPSPGSASPAEDPSSGGGGDFGGAGSDGTF